MPKIDLGLFASAISSQYLPRFARTWTHPDGEIHIEAAGMAGPFQCARFTGVVSLLCRGVGGDAAGFYHAVVGLHRHGNLFCQVGVVSLPCV